METKKERFRKFAESWCGGTVHIQEEELYQKERYPFKDLPPDCHPCVNHIRRFNDRYTTVVHFPDYGPIAVHYSRIRKEFDGIRYKVKAIIDAPHLFTPITTYLGVNSEGCPNIRVADKDILQIMKSAPDLCWKDILLLPTRTLTYVQFWRNFMTFLTEPVEGGTDNA